MNNQQVNQVLTFYRINFHFHDPYKFLLDGNFIKLILEKQIDFKRRLQNVINGKIRFYVPSCLIRQLQLLGNDFKLVLQKAKQFRVLSCNHPLEVSVDRCIIKNFVKQDNPQKYIVCTQDIQLRRLLREVLNCPLMYFGPDQRIKFEDVHKKNVVLIQREAKQKLLPKQNQMGQIIEYKNEIQMRRKKQQKKEKIRLAAQMGMKLKNKIARGPNPLSVKIKSNKQYQSQNYKKQKQQNKVQQKMQVSGNNVQKTKRIRKRKNKNKNNDQINYTIQKSK